MKVEKILDFLKSEEADAVYYGSSIEIDSFSNLEEIQEHSIIWVKNGKYLTENTAARLESCQEVLAVCTEKMDCMKNCIVTAYPKQIYFSILRQFFLKQRARKIDKNAVVLTDRIGKNVNIGPFCYVSEETEIADDVYIHANVTIEGRCSIGKGSEIFSGAVIGTDGFGYYRIHGTTQKVPHFKGVIIGDCVEIGANTCIDRGCLDDTKIGNHVKIDNLCHIAHNVCIEDNCVITAGSVIAGSAELGEGVYVAPGAVIKNQLIIADRAFIGMGAVVTKPVETGRVVAGVPAEVLRNREDRDF